MNCYLTTFTYNFTKHNNPINLYTMEQSTREQEKPNGALLAYYYDIGLLSSLFSISGASKMNL